MSFVWDRQDAVCLVATATKLGSRQLGSSCWCLLLPLPLSQHLLVPAATTAPVPL